VVVRILTRRGGGEGVGGGGGQRFVRKGWVSGVIRVIRVY
jgi:hypothetical protein